MVAIQHVVDPNVTSDGRVGHEGTFPIGKAEPLHVCSGDEPGAGEVECTDLAAGVEMVPFVPAVVLHLVASMRLDQRE